MKLRDQALLKVELPTRPAIQRFPWKTNIVTTVFWVGEQAGANNPVSNYRSSWDTNWTGNYGGLDDPDSSTRRNFIPVAFIPRQNPFYCALPYNDVMDGQFKPEAPLVIPWFKQAYTGPGQSVCKGRWVAIRKENRTCYAQWEDCGPFRTDHFQYVFQNERPKPNLNDGAVALGWMFLPQSAITSDSNRRTRPIGNLSRRGMCLWVPGGATAKTTISSSRGGKPSST